MANSKDFYYLGDNEALQQHIRVERERGKKLRKTSWWKSRIQEGKCHFCHKLVGGNHLTMDHVVPLARGGSSTRGNVVPACAACNRHKKLSTPVETLLDYLQDSDSR